MATRGSRLLPLFFRLSTRALYQLSSFRLHQNRTETDFGPRQSSLHYIHPIIVGASHGRHHSKAAASGEFNCGKLFPNKHDAAGVRHDWRVALVDSLGRPAAHAVDSRIGSAQRDSRFLTRRNQAVPERLSAPTRLRTVPEMKQLSNA